MGHFDLQHRLYGYVADPLKNPPYIQKTKNERFLGPKNLDSLKNFGLGSMSNQFFGDPKMGYRDMGRLVGIQRGGLITALGYKYCPRAPGERS